MKKARTYFILFVLLLAIGACDKGTTADLIVWRGKLEVDWHADKEFYPEIFDSLRAGDELIIGVEYTGSEWPLVTLFDEMHTGMAGAGRVVIDENTREVSFSVTSEMDKVIHKGGIVLSGEGYNVTSIGIKRNKDAIDIENAVWFGHIEISSEKNSTLSFSRRTFYKIHEGDVMQFKLSEVNDSAYMTLHSTQWQSLPNSTTNINGSNVIEYAIDHEGLELMRRDGLLISGKGYSLDRIDVKSPIWSGSELINWYEYAGGVKLDSTLFKDAKVGDKIVACYAYIGGDDWPQIAFFNSKWTEITGTGRTLVYSNMHNKSVYITKDMLEEIKRDGIIVTGVGYILKAVSLIDGKLLPYMEDASWIGDTQMTPDWNTMQLLAPKCFANAKAGDIMRLKVSKVHNDAMISLRPGSWGYFDKMEVAHINPHTEYYDYVLTDYLLNAINKNDGCVIFGTGYNLNAMQIIKQ